MGPESNTDVADLPRTLSGSEDGVTVVPTNLAPEAGSLDSVARPGTDQGTTPNSKASVVDGHRESGEGGTSQAVKLKVRDLLLNALTVSSGAIDAISFLALGKVFSAFMTGNIAFLGLQVAGAGGPGMVAIVVAMVGFAMGVYLSTRIVKLSGYSGIWPRPVTVALSISLIAHAVFLAFWFANGGQPSHNVSHVLLGSWGVAMGMQSAAVRRLHVEGVFTTAATATVIFLVGDLTTWSATAAERRRLAGVLISLFIGATAGGLLLVHAPIYAPVLPFAITVVTVATAAIALRESRENDSPEVSKT